MNIIFKPGKDLRSQNILKQMDIPCVSKVGTSFEIAFESPLPSMTGAVTDWDRKSLAERAPAGAGGTYTHYRPSLISLQQLGDDIFQITNLKMFYESFGWLAIVENGEYAAPGLIWDE